MIKCPECGSTRIEDGHLEGLGHIGFRPANIKFMTLKTKIPVQAWVCLDCGRVETKCDAEDLKQIITDDAEPPLPT